MYTLRRDALAGGVETTVYVVRYPRERLRVGVRVFRQPRRLDHWCARHGVGEAVVGGFYRREPFRPLGEVRIDGREVAGERFHAPYDAVRPALLATAEGLRIARRDALPPSRRATCCRRGRCSSPTAGSPSTRRPTRRASARGRSSSTPTSPRGVIRGRRSGSATGT